jgi:hypothetical protein
MACTCRNGSPSRHPPNGCQRRILHFSLDGTSGEAQKRGHMVTTRAERLLTVGIVLFAALMVLATL